MSDDVDRLAVIMARKRSEVARRLRRRVFYAERAGEAIPAPTTQPLAEVLRRPVDSAPRVIAEIKLRSPSAGEIRARRPGEIVIIAQGYAAHATAVSVLCDGPGFGGSVLDLRRVTRAIKAPVLFKEFVIDPVQIDLARAAGATFVLLLVRVLDDVSLCALIEAVRARGLEPIVEAADAEELSRALRTPATVIGINARDLRSFSLNAQGAVELVDRIPVDRVAVFMSGVRSAEDFRRIARTRADAVLVGEGLMRCADPAQQLAAWLADWRHTRA